MDRQKLTKSKLEGYSGKPTGGSFPVIVKVSQQNYIPAGVSVRKIITPYIFTADANDSILQRLKQDEHVISVSVNRSLGKID